MILRVEDNKSIAFKMSAVQLMNKRLYNELMACKQAARLLQHLRVCRQAISEPVNCELFMARNGAFVVQKKKKKMRHFFFCHPTPVVLWHGVSRVGFPFQWHFFGPLSPFSIHSPTLKIKQSVDILSTLPRRWKYSRLACTCTSHRPVVLHWGSLWPLATFVFLTMMLRLKFIGQHVATHQWRNADIDYCCFLHVALYPIGLNGIVVGVALLYGLAEKMLRK